MGRLGRQRRGIGAEGRGGVQSLAARGRRGGPAAGLGGRLPVPALARHRALAPGGFRLFDVRPPQVAFRLVLRHLELVPRFQVPGFGERLRVRPGVPQPHCAVAAHSHIVSLTDASNSAATAGPMAAIASSANLFGRVPGWFTRFANMTAPCPLLPTQRRARAWRAAIGCGPVPPMMYFAYEAWL